MRRLIFPVLLVLASPVFAGNIGSTMPGTLSRSELPPPRPGNDGSSQSSAASVNALYKAVKRSITRYEDQRTLLNAARKDGLLTPEQVAPDIRVLNAAIKEARAKAASLKAERDRQNRLSNGQASQHDMRDTSADRDGYRARSGN